MNIWVVFTIAVFGVMGVGVLAGYLLDRCVSVTSIRMPGPMALSFPGFSN